jgi:hypothetical protein
VFCRPARLRLKPETAIQPSACRAAARRYRVLQKKRGRFKAELKDLTERVGVVPDGSQHGVPHIRGRMPDRAFDQLGDVVAVERYLAGGRDG